MDLKRIIREELANIIESNVIRPKFGGGGGPRRPMSPFQRVLDELDRTIINSLNSEGPDMDDDEVVKLEELQDIIHKLQSGSREICGPRQVSSPTENERDELRRFNQYMKLQDEEDDV
jgi:hypothetical protein